MGDGRSFIRVNSRRGLFGKRWYFTPIAGNNEIVTQSEGYNSRSACYNGIRATCQVFGGDVDQLTIYEDGMKMTAYGR